MIVDMLDAGSVYTVVTLSFMTIKDACKVWKKNRQLHREDGPAVAYAGGSKYWYINDQLHREDGPAKELEREWFLHGKKITEDEFKSHNQKQGSISGSNTREWKDARGNYYRLEVLDGVEYWCRNGKRYRKR